MKVTVETKKGLEKRSIKNDIGKDESIFLRSVENILTNNKTKAEVSIEKFQKDNSLKFLYEKISLSQLSSLLVENHKEMRDQIENNNFSEVVGFYADSILEWFYGLSLSVFHICNNKHQIRFF